VLADYVTTRDARVILDSVLPRYDIVLTDTPPALNDVVITALARSDMVYVLATLDVPSLRNLSAFLDVLDRLKLPTERLRLVLNKTEDDVGVTVTQANDAFGGRFGIVLPADRAVSRAVNLGTTVAVTEPRSRVSRAIAASINTLATELDLGGDNDSSTTASYDVRPERPLARLWRYLVPGGSS
jgi:pilus assembly protein CpaE